MCILELHRQVSFMPRLNSCLINNNYGNGSVGSGSWVMSGVTTHNYSSEENHTTVQCSSTHLTSFAVLVDVAGVLVVGIISGVDPNRSRLYSIVLHTGYRKLRKKCTSNCVLYRLCNFHSVSYSDSSLLSLTRVGVYIFFFFLCFG